MDPAAYWAASAAGWVHHADRHDVRGKPLGEVAMRRLDARPGERILDVGCGVGGTTAELAAVCAATGVDLSEEMIAAARVRFPDVGFLAGDVGQPEVLPERHFDGAYARTVLMLFADPVAGCAGILRALRPGGRLAATVFRSGAGNAWLPAATLGAAPHLGPMPPLPVGDEPGPFAFGAPERIGKVLAAAGFADVAVEPHDVVLSAPDDPDDVAEWLIELGPAGVPYRQAEPSARRAALAGAAKLLARFRVPGEGYRIPAALWLVTARRPAD